MTATAASADAFIMVEADRVSTIYRLVLASSLVAEISLHGALALYFILVAWITYIKTIHECLWIKKNTHTRLNNFL